MVQYVDHDFYSNIYKGNMPLADFNSLCIKATAKVNTNTFGRLEKIPSNQIPDEVKYCVCALCEKMYKNSKGEGKQSETVGPHTVNYANNTSETQNEEYLEIIKEFLGEVCINNIPILYRGC